MTVYIDRDYIYTEIGEEKTNALLAAGGTESASYGPKLDQYISQSSSRFRGYIAAKGATVETVTEDIKLIVGGLVLDTLFVRAGQAQVPAGIQDRAEQTFAILNLFAENKTGIEGLTYDSVTSPGGATAKYPTTGSSNATRTGGLFSVDESWGTYF